MLPRLFRTASFRLTAVFALLFATSVVVLAAIVYFRTGAMLEEQMRLQIEAQMGTLMLEYADEGLVELRDETKDAIEQSPENRLLYFLQNPSGQIVFDELNEPMSQPYGWTEGTTSDGRRVLLYSQGLTDGYVFGVGGDLTPIQQARTAVLAAFAWALLSTLVIGLVGGIIISRRFLRSVEAITRSAERIGEGKLEERLPLRQTRDELDQLAKAINRMLDRIQLLVENIQRVSSNIAHDLRTPLGHLQQRLERLGQQNLPANAKHELEEAERQLEETLEIFAAILRIAEIDSGLRKVDFVELDLSDLLRHVVDVFEPAAEKSGHQLIGSIVPGVKLQGDRQLLMQLFSNLIENGLRHTPSGTSIWLTMAVQKDAVCVTVADNGPGVPAEFQDEIFKPFYRLQESRSEKGSGLGLSLVASIARLHNITIQISSNQPGLKMTLYFKNVSQVSSDRLNWPEA